MFSLTPSLECHIAAQNLTTLMAPRIDPSLFQSAISTMQNMFSAYGRSCPPPWCAPGLAITPEINYQSELWLPLARIKPAFDRFYRAALTYAPILSSSPFNSAASWAAVAAVLPSFCRQSADPSTLLKQLLSDNELRTKFLCWSFMPRRFNGSGSDRYPSQSDYIRTWLARKRGEGAQLRCLDAACGDGAATYGLAHLIHRMGWQSGSFAVEGWTLDPLEVWSAARACFPHDPHRQNRFRASLEQLFSAGAQQNMLFRSVDLEEICSGQTPRKDGAGFDLILCNGLLGGPIIHQLPRLGTIVRNLTALLRPGGLLLAADHFHGGWKRDVTPQCLAGLFRSCGLSVFEAGEGIGGRL